MVKNGESMNKKHRYINNPGRLLLSEIKAVLDTKIIAKELKYYSKISSTNQEARKIAEHGAQDGTIIIAETQTQGRGRQGRSWESPAGGIWLTIILRPKISPEHAPILTLLTGSVIAKTIRYTTELKATLKWPNDVRIHDKKVCGILTELSAEQDNINFVLVGLGINVNINIDRFPQELQSQVTSLQEELKRSVDRITFTKRLLEQFETEYLKFLKNPINKIPAIIKTWRQLSDTLGRNVVVETNSGKIVGFASDIADDGALIVLTETGEEHKIIAGDCIYLEQ